MHQSCFQTFQIARSRWLVVLIIRWYWVYRGLSTLLVRIPKGNWVLDTDTMSIIALLSHKSLKYRWKALQPVVSAQLFQKTLKICFCGAVVHLDNFWCLTGSNGLRPKSLKFQLDKVSVLHYQMKALCIVGAIISQENWALLTILQGKHRNWCNSSIPRMWHRFVADQTSVLHLGKHFSQSLHHRWIVQKWRWAPGMAVSFRQFLITITLIISNV